MKLLILFILCTVSFSSFAKSANSKIINSESIATSTTSIISEVVNLGDAERFSLFSYLEGGSTATGTVSILLSNDVTNDPALVSNWVVYGTDKTFTTSSTKLLSNITDVAAKWVKTEYTKVGEATGTLNTIINIP